MSTNLAYQEDFRKELIGGRVIAMSPATTRHNRIAENIYFTFRTFLKGKRCVPLGDGYDLYLTDQDRFIPDFMIVCDRDKIKPKGVYGPPDLVVEVLSPSTMRNDRMRKKEVYQACGVREYWLVDPENRTIEQYLLQDGKLELNMVYASCRDDELERMSEQEKAELETHFQCSLYSDFDIALEDIFSGLLP